MAAKKVGQRRSRAGKAKKRPRKAARGAKRSTSSRGRTGLTAMSLDALLRLREEAERLIRTRAAAERSALEKQLARLGGYFGTTPRRRPKRSSLKGRKVPPKYRNPDKKSETWAGRGVRPRWLQAKLREGHKLEQFAVR